MQVIATTHSPLTISDVDTHQGEAILLRQVDKGVEVISDFPSVRGWRADQILASELFDYIIDRDPTKVVSNR